MITINDTIAAISSAAGSGNRAIVRLTGPEAIAIAESLFLLTDGRALRDLGGFRAAEGLLHLAEASLELPARAYVFRNPASYTRQDLVELHIPGSPAVATATLHAMLAAGARRANAGEFTARAFLSGRIDLSAAEAVADVIVASDDQQLRAAQAAMGGAIYRRCAVAAQSIAEVLAIIEASIDMAEENLSLATPAELTEQLQATIVDITQLADSASDMPDTVHMPQVTLAGRPNAGKSSLLNALCGTRRAITSPIAGTTRDVLSGMMALPCGAMVNLLDAAGFLHDGPDTHLDIAAHQAATAAVARADLILLVRDLTAAPPTSDLTALIRAANANAPILTIWNKADLSESPAAYLDTEQCAAEEYYVSAVGGEGLIELKQALTDQLHVQVSRSGEALGLHDRQRRCLTAAAEAAVATVALLETACDPSDVAELAAVELRTALAELGAISGEIVTDDLLGIIFSRFCVGK